MTTNGVHSPNIAKANHTRHSTYWFDDGSLILHAQGVSYNLHKNFLTRLSPTLQTLAANTEDGYEVAVLRIPEELGVKGEDFDRLLEHLYHDIPLDSDRQLARLGAILRVSSEQQLNFPSVHRLAREKFLSLYPRTLDELLHPEFADQALALAVQYQLYPVQKALFYCVATHMHFEDHDGVEVDPAQQWEKQTVTSVDVPSDVLKRCKNLLDQLLAHFTPILFTVATAGHMECTDVLAEKWMPLVIGPALENNGLCRPIETLQTIMDLDWSSNGLCQECIGEKKREWRGEQEVVWDLMDKWLGLQGQ